MKKLLLTILLFTLHLAIFSSPAKEDLNAGKFIIDIGTTAVIEKAEVGEYAYDMLTSGFSNLPLVSKDTNGVYSPLVASFDTQDSKTWNYEITPGLTWSDGVEVTAEDILFTLIYEDQNGSANFIDQIDSKGKVTESKYIGYTLSEDKKTLSLVLRDANIRELSNMTSFRIVPSHLYSDGDITIADKRVTCGPFVFSSFDSLSGTIEFVQNKFYPVKPNVEKIVVHLFGSEDTMYMALNNGDLDFTFIYNSGVGENYLDVLKENNNLEILSANGQGIPLVLCFNNSSEKLSDINIRKAISYALDYEVIRKYVGGSGASIANRGVVPASTFGYIETQKLEQNLSLAATHLHNSGYEKVGAYYQKDGEVLSLTLSYRLDKTAQVAGAELIKTQLETFGIKVNLDGLDSASYNAKTSNKFSNNNISFEMALFGFTSAGVEMGSGIATIYVDKFHNVQGGCQVSDEAFQKLLKELKSAKTIEEYYLSATKIQEYYETNTPLIALYHDNNNYVAIGEYEGYAIDSLFGINNVNTYINLKRK